MADDFSKEYLCILEEELVLALGCTEPIAIALAAATAKNALSGMPTKLNVQCSGNVLKNAMAVVVPKTQGMMGVKTSAVLGALAGNAEKGLEVLQDVRPEDVEKTKLLLEKDICQVHLMENTLHSLHIVVTAQLGKDIALAEICGTHTNIVKIEKNGKTILQKDLPNPQEKGKPNRSLLNLKDIYAFANSAKSCDLEPIVGRQLTYNIKIAQEGLENAYGGQVGRTIAKAYGKKDLRANAKALASAASDARMGGCALPVVINSGSGNQGIAASVPVIAYAQHLKIGGEKLLRALALSNLVTLLIKREIGRLSAFCGAVCAACGSGAAITYLCEGSLEKVANTITNTLANVSGIVCDGAKASCAAKVATAVDAAITAHEMAMDGNFFGPCQGIVKQNVEKTIESVGKMARQGMVQTDKEILQIMLLED